MRSGSKKWELGGGQRRVPPETVLPKPIHDDPYAADDFLIGVPLDELEGTMSMREGRL
jgi:hypothetical protein